jgi:hypothetical protein
VKGLKVATVNSRTTISIDELVNDTIVDGVVIGGHLLLTTRGGDVIDAGLVTGDADVTVFSYIYDQGVAASVWVINHPLAFRPNVSVVDSTGRQVEGDVVYTDNDTVTITFSAAFAGTAYLS